MRISFFLVNIMIAAFATSAHSGSTSKASGRSSMSAPPREYRSLNTLPPRQTSRTYRPATTLTPAARSSQMSSQKAPPPRLSAPELRRTKENYEQHVLKNKPDPYPALMQGSSNIAAGPQGSSLLAMVKIPNSGKGKYYKSQANKLIAQDQDVANAIRRDHLQPGETLVIDPKGQRNPYIQRTDGSKKSLEWHHSPNHIGSVSLIPTDTHRITGGKALLHYDKNKGGNEMYNTQYK